jgi:hypothetical protein
MPEALYIPMAGEGTGMMRGYLRNILPEWRIVDLVEDFGEVKRLPLA